MPKLSLKVIEALVNSSSPDLRRRYKKACDLPPRDIATHYMSRGQLITGILKFELHATGLLTTDTNHEINDAS